MFSIFVLNFYVWKLLYSLIILMYMHIRCEGVVCPARLEGVLSNGWSFIRKGFLGSCTHYPTPSQFSFCFLYISIFKVGDFNICFLWVYMHKRCDRAVVLLVWKEFWVIVEILSEKSISEVAPTTPHPVYFPYKINVFYKFSAYF